MRTVIHPCKIHKDSHDYTVCPVCQHQYCARIWPNCPNERFHVKHSPSVSPAADRAVAEVVALREENARLELRVSELEAWIDSTFREATTARNAIMDNRPGISATSLDRILDYARAALGAKP